MKLQHGKVVSDAWIPKGEPTGIKDIEGNELVTGEWVYLSNCEEKKAIIGKTIPEFLHKQPKWLLLFGSEDGSVQWFLDEKKVVEHKIKKVEK